MRSEVELSSGGGGGLFGCCRRLVAYEQGGVEGAQSQVGQVAGAALGGSQPGPLPGGPPPPPPPAA